MNSLLLYHYIYQHKTRSVLINNDNLQTAHLVKYTQYIDFAFIYLT